MKTKIIYPYIEKLGIKIYEKPYPHIINEDLEKALSEMEIKLFNDYFGCQTVLRRDDGRIGIYPCDCESVLVRIFTKKLTGTQKYWD